MRRIRTYKLVDRRRVESWVNVNFCDWVVGVSWDYDGDLFASLHVGCVELSVVWWER